MVTWEAQFKLLAKGLALRDLKECEDSFPVLVFEVSHGTNDGPALFRYGDLI